MSTEEPTWRNRIVESGVVAATELTANPRNARRHPAEQRAALRGVLEDVGWIGRVIVNRTTGLVVDGHLRVEEAAERGEDVPVDYVELTPAEEMLALAVFDPIGSLAQTDAAAMDELIAGIQTGDAGLTSLLADLATAAAGRGFGPEDFAGNVDVGETFAVTVVCADVGDQETVFDALAATYGAERCRVVTV